MTATPAWPPPIGTAVYIGAHCKHWKWGEMRFTWTGDELTYQVLDWCSERCPATFTARWTETT